MIGLEQFENQEFLSIETFRKSGVGVKTPVWFAQEGDVLYMRTGSTSGKVKRIRNNQRVNIAPCTRMGEVTGEWVAAQAALDDSDGAMPHVDGLLRKKLGFSYTLFSLVTGLMNRRRQSTRVCIKVLLIENG